MQKTSRNATLRAGAMMPKPFMKQLAWWQHGFQPIGGQGLAMGNAYMSHTVPHTRRLRVGAKRVRRSGAQQALMGRGNDDPNVADDEGAPILCPVCAKGGYTTRRTAPTQTLRLPHTSNDELGCVRPKRLTPANGGQHDDPFASRNRNFALKR